MPINVITFIVYGFFMPMDDEYTANMLLCLNESYCRQNSFIYSITLNNIIVVTVVLVLGFIQYI